MVNFDVFVQVWTNRSSTHPSTFDTSPQNLVKQTKQYFMATLTNVDPYWFSWTIEFTTKSWKNFCFSKILQKKIQLEFTSSKMRFSDMMHFSLLLMKSWFAVILLPRLQTTHLKRCLQFQSQKNSRGAILFYCPCHTFQIKVVCKGKSCRKRSFKALFFTATISFRLKSLVWKTFRLPYH